MSDVQPTDFKPRSDLVRTLLERGHIYQATDLAGLDAAALKGPISAYIGFDATGSSLHVGSLVQIMTLRRLQKTGHKPIVLMGGGTTKVGDPSDKTGQRPLLSDETIAANIAGIQRAFAPFLSFDDSQTGAVMVNNADWLERLGYIDFLREFGVEFTVNRLLTLEFVKNRIDSGQPLTVLEFNYVLMQAVDFLELHRRYGCTLQFGGSEQWGNIVNGIDLIRRRAGAEAFGVTAPLVTTSSGVKMGKTVDGAVWLNAEMRSPYEYWQFWRNTEDADVGRFLKLFTELPLDEIAKLAALQGSQINEAKKVLANEATTMLHGAAAAEAAAAAAKAAAEGSISRDLPTFLIPRREGETEFTFGRTPAAILKYSGLVRSMKEARQKIMERAVRINDQLIDAKSADVAISYGAVDPISGAYKVQLGKNLSKIVLVIPEPL